MIATQDVAQVAAELMIESWEGRRIIEIEGPQRISPNQIAGTLAELLGREVSQADG